MDGISLEYLFIDRYLHPLIFLKKRGEQLQLYKVMRELVWEDGILRLEKGDETFIHFSTAGQLDRIIEKFFSDCPQYHVLQINSDHLEGELILEANLRGTTKY